MGLRLIKTAVFTDSTLTFLCSHSFPLESSLHEGCPYIKCPYQENLLYCKVVHTAKLAIMISADRFARSSLPSYLLFGLIRVFFLAGSCSSW